MYPYSFVLAVWLLTCQTVRLQGNIISHLLYRLQNIYLYLYFSEVKGNTDTSNINRDVLLLMKGFEQ